MQKKSKKSEWNAQTAYDYRKLTYPDEKFLSCVITEEEEELVADYEIQNYSSCTEIRNLSGVERLRVLVDVQTLEGKSDEYLFSLAPQNLYYDENYRVKVMERDIPTNREEDCNDFLKQYKALAAFALQKKYSYEDYVEGGEDLYRKNRLLQQISETKDSGELKNLLEQEYVKEKEKLVRTKILVSKKSYRMGRLMLVIIGISLCVCGGYLAELLLEEKPVLEAKLQAECDYLKKDYIRVVDDLKQLPMNRLSYDQKYVLSVSYVNLESLSLEQKQNILDKLPVNGDEKLMEYWIYIGRLQPVEAENIAMQKSDDELLLYAYMLDKDLTEADENLNGEEKAQKLEDLESKISHLAEVYMKEE